jgi:CMP-N-acetylneuraminic acid synthetase
VRVAAFIPARGGSKRVPGKNLAMVGGASLLHRALDAALRTFGPEETMTAHRVTVSTDCPDIEAHARTTTLRPWAQRIDIHHRPAPLASDHAQIESAMQHWWTRLDTKPDVVVLLQPTSPFRTSAHVRAAIDLLTTASLDSVVGVTQSHAPHFAGRLKPREVVRLPRVGDEWILADEEAMERESFRIVEISGSGRVLADDSYHRNRSSLHTLDVSEVMQRYKLSGSTPTSWYEWQPFGTGGERPRTQDLPPRGWENGSLYAFTREHWECTGNRLGGRMGALPMDWIEGFDIDTQEDLDAARAIAEGMGI